MRAVSSFDHLVGGGLKRQRHRQPESLCSLEVDQELKFAGPNDRQVARLLSLKNASGVDADLVVGVCNTRPVAHQATGYDGIALGVARWQRMASRECDYPF